MDGLAAMQAQGQQAPQQGGGQVDIQQVMQLLMQGIPPEELVQQGIPVEIIKQAIQMLMQQQQEAQGGGAQTATGRQMTGGLAEQTAGKM